MALVWAVSVEMAYYPRVGCSTHQHLDSKVPLHWPGGLLHVGKTSTFGHEYRASA